MTFIHPGDNWRNFNKRTGGEEIIYYLIRSKTKTKVGDNTERIIYKYYMF